MLFDPNKTFSTFEEGDITGEVYLISDIFFGYRWKVQFIRDSHTIKSIYMESKLKEEDLMTPKMWPELEKLEEMVEQALKELKDEKV